MTARPGLTRAAVIDAAAGQVDRKGTASLTLSSVAKELGVKSPSLYNHVGSLGDLRRELRLRGISELGKRLGEAAVGRSGADAVGALARAYRAFVRERPGLYELTIEAATATDDELRGASDSVLAVVLAALRAYDLQGDELIHAARFLRSTLHGFVALESAGGFGLRVSVEESFERMLGILTAGLERGFTD